VQQTKQKPASRRRKEGVVMKTNGSRNGAQIGWLAVGGLLALGMTYFFIRELPAVRRELHIMRM
jgi:hypothetical protein